jgi:hypothetical protein
LTSVQNARTIPEVVPTNRDGVKQTVHQRHGWDDLRVTHPGGERYVCDSGEPYARIVSGLRYTELAGREANPAEFGNYT